MRALRFHVRFLLDLIQLRQGEVLVLPSRRSLRRHSCICFDVSNVCLNLRRKEEKTEEKRTTKKRKIKIFSHHASSLHSSAKAVVEGTREHGEKERERETDRERLLLRVVVFDAFFLSL